MSEAEARELGRLAGLLEGMQNELTRLSDAVEAHVAALSSMKLTGCAVGQQNAAAIKKTSDDLDTVKRTLSQSSFAPLRAIVAGGGGAIFMGMMAVVVLSAVRMLLGAQGTVAFLLGLVKLFGGT